MNQLEENNILAQISLMKDIIKNYESIVYHIQTSAKEALTSLHTKNIEQNVPSAQAKVTILLPEYEKIADILIDLSDKRKWHKLGILCTTAIPDNETKLEILQKLTKNT